MAPTKPVWKLDVGDEAPDFTLRATGAGAGRGEVLTSVTLSAYRGRRNVMLAFYPAAFTPV
jgi:peroxiredoxin